MAIALELRNVKKTYEAGKVKVPVLHGISLKVEKGDFISIMGPSGSGKSTLLNMIGCLDTVTSGKVIISGKDASMMGEDELALIRRERIGFIFQQYNLLPRMTALENVMFPMWLKGVPKDEREEKAMELLRLVGLEHRVSHTPSEMSGGEKQRVAIARALANDPAFILADEPTGNLDSKTGRDIMDLLERLHEEKNMTLVIVTHEKELGDEAHKRIKIRDGLIEEIIVRKRGYK